MTAHTNQLIHETSPYLLQHAHNPVDWYSWNDEAWQKAKEQNKPVLVSIGYAACHWCHVMERESFEDETTAAFMNENFINIKIDREERPDLDHIYMDAVQAMTGSGGWPLNVFLTPEKKPFYGGTYFPSQRSYNRASWMETLQGVASAFREKREAIDQQAEQLTGHIFNSNSFGFSAGDAKEMPRALAADAAANLLRTADKKWGGFGRAPKFPQTFSIQFLLRHYWLTENEEALQQALLSLDKMIDGGIYDQVGGGFARYSTDEEWLAPHFEKMLYDNALLISVLSEAYQLTKKERYKEVIKETVDFVLRELSDEDGGFFSALDADSEGEEGKYYVWQKEDIEAALGDDAPLFCEYYDISGEGNWEEKNILRVLKSSEQFAGEKGMKTGQWKSLLKELDKKILAIRYQREAPLTDDKILLCWNALMITALCKAWAATGEDDYRRLAEQNAGFLLHHFKKQEETALYHVWKNGRAKYPAFLDDYAFFIQALLHLQEVTGNLFYLGKANELTEFVIRHFTADDGCCFYYTHAEQQDVIVRKKEVYDGATPSGNAVMAENLYRLGILVNNAGWRERAWQMTGGLQAAIIKYPVSFGYWNIVLQELLYGSAEIAVTGPEAVKRSAQVLSEYLPHKVLMFSVVKEERYPLLKGKYVDNKTLIYLCRNFQCEQPVVTIEELMALIRVKRA